MKQRFFTISTISFKRIIWNYYHNNKRIFAWRKTTDPYNILVSEFMLQQTQTKRVEKKYGLFLSVFPTVECLSKATLSQVLCIWQGLGYNRRAKFLLECAKEIMNTYHGVFPQSKKILETLPGIGPYTASAIVTFAYNKPTTFIETNIQTVYLYFFFPNKNNVDNKSLLPFIQATLDNKNPRQWYYALMDYGVFLKQTVGNISCNSKQYVKQSKFEGSDRQIRGAIIRLLTNNGYACLAEIQNCIGREKNLIQKNIQALIDDQMIYQEKNRIFLGEK